MLFNLTELGLLKISGNDAESFLQGQLTNDMTALNGVWHYSGYCSPKGRLLALFQAWRQDDSFYLLLSHDLIESIVKRLRMYVMRSKVVIEVIEDAQIIGINNPEDINAFGFSEQTARTVLSSSAQQQNEINQYCTLLNISQTGFAARWILVDWKTDEDDCKNSDASIVSGSSITFADKTDAWQQLNIEQGLPQVELSSSELFIPQMLNLDLLDGINMKKGCYTGQEIVARMHYLGKLKQRMFLFDLQGSNKDLAEIKAGDKVFSDAECEKSTGNVVLANSSANQLLAVVRIDNLTQTLYITPEISINTASQKFAYSTE